MQNKLEITREEEGGGAYKDGGLRGTNYYE